MQAFHVVWRAIRDLYDDLFVFVPLSLLWWLCFLVIIPLPPAVAGLVYLANEIAHERRIEWRMAVEGARLFFWRSWVVFLVSVLGFLVVGMNIWFYLNQFTGLPQYLTILWLYLLIIWSAAQIYVYPLLIAMEKPRVLLIFRNALLLTLANPLFTVLLLVLFLALTVVSVAFPLLLILVLPGLLSLVSTRALVYLVERVRQIQSHRDHQDDEKHDEDHDTRS